ncbi:MAG: tetratricopeptide repeat protein [bacterium]|nr:tetratricopeptide repeat protein [bacterium]
MNDHRPGRGGGARRAIPLIGCNLLALALAGWPSVPAARAETPPAEGTGSVAPAAAVETDVDGGPLERPDLYDLEQVPRFERKVLLRASLYTKNGDPVTAAHLLDEHLRDHPTQDHSLVRLHLAQNHADAGNTAAARDNYRRAVELEPRLERAWFGLADACYELTEYADAARAFEQGYAASPDRPAEVLYYAAASWLMAEQPTESMRVLEKLTRSPDEAPQLRWVQCYLAAANRVQQPEAASPALTRLLDAYPDDPDAWYLRYQYEAARRDFQGAAVALRVVGHLRELTPTEQKQLGDLLMAAGVSQLASEHYRRGLTPVSSLADVERLASALVAAHETEQALEVLRGALAGVEAGQPTTRLWSLIGDVHYVRQEYAEALDAFARVAADGDESGRAWLMQGYCALELGKRDEALDLLARASGFAEHEDLAQRLIQRALRLKDS